MFRQVARVAVRPMARAVTVPATQFKSDKDPSLLEFQSVASIENLYEFNVSNVTQYNIELRKLADLKVNDKIKSTFEVMKSKRIKPDATTIEILARSCEPANARRAVLFFDEVIKFEIDPTPETYKTLAAIFKAAKEEKSSALLTAMAKDEDIFGSDRFCQLVDEFHKIAAQ